MLPHDKIVAYGYGQLLTQASYTPSNYKLHTYIQNTISPVSTAPVLTTQENGNYSCNYRVLTCVWDCVCLCIC